MSEITTTAAQERVTVYIDMFDMPDDDYRLNTLEIGHYLGLQGVTDYVPTLMNRRWISLEVSADDAVALKLRFPIVPDGEIKEFEEETSRAKALQSSLRQQINSISQNYTGLTAQVAAQAQSQLQITLASEAQRQAERQMMERERARYSEMRALMDEEMERVRTLDLLRSSIKGSTP